MQTSRCNYLWLLLPTASTEQPHPTPFSPCVRGTMSEGHKLRFPEDSKPPPSGSDPACWGGAGVFPSEGGRMRGTLVWWLAILALVLTCDAGSFLSGSLRWRTVSGNHVRFDAVTYWSRDFSPFVGTDTDGKLRVGDNVKVSAQQTVKLDFGDGNSSFIYGTVVDVDKTAGWVAVHSVHDKHYGAPAYSSTLRQIFEGEGDVQTDGKTYVIDYVPWSASITGCCRYKDQSNDAGLKFSMSTTVNTVKASASPDARNLPEISLVSQDPHYTNFTVPAPLPTQSPANPMVGVVTYAWCPSSVWTIPTWASGAYTVSIDQDTGVVTWPHLIDTHGLYHLCVEISANPNDPAQGVLSQTDFRVRVQANTTNPPSVDLSPYGSPGAFSMLSPFWNGVYIGFSNELSLSAEGFNNSMSRIDIASGFRGPGSSYTLDQSNGSTVVTITYDPLPGYSGWSLFCFQARDSVTLATSSQACINLNITVDAKPFISARASTFQVSATGFRLREGQQLDAIVNGFKPADQDNVTIYLKTDLEGANSFEQISVGHNASSLFQYTPPRKYAGTTQAACFAARGAPGPLRVQEEAVTCLDIEIERCVWTIKEGESLLSMAQDLGMSWLQLWNYNKMTIRKPDQDLLAGSGIRVGQLYSVQNGDSLYNIAERYSTSVERLVAINADLTESTLLQVGQSICVSFDSCTA